MTHVMFIIDLLSNSGWKEPQEVS